MKIIFAGTPDFAATALSALIAAGHDIALVLSQPDRPSGRGMKLTASPVKALALKHNLPVITPLTLSLKRAPQESAQIHQQLKNIGADLLVVAAYGLILPQAVLDCTRGIGEKGDIRAINIHGSLLPRWRGAAPVTRAIEAGDAQTGITLMKMELGLDTGPMISKTSTAITKEDTTDTLMSRLAKLGAELLVTALQTPDRLTYEEQKEEGVTYAEKMTKAEGHIRWADSAEQIERRIRAFTPFPGSFTMKDDIAIKLWKAKAIALDHQSEPGTVLSTEQGLLIACGQGALLVSSLQRPGKPKMDVVPFLQSLPIELDEVLK